MLMPKKHINVSESLIGLGGIILAVIGENIKTLDNIINEINKTLEIKKTKKIYNNIDNIILAIDYLYLIGAVDINEKGEIYNVFS